MILKLNTLQQLHPNFSNFLNKLVGGYLGIFRGGVLPGFPTPSLQLGSSGQKKKRAREKDTREGRPHPSRAPVLSFAHYFQAPATQAIQLQTLFQTKTRISTGQFSDLAFEIHIPVFSNLAFEKLYSVWEPITSSTVDSLLTDTSIRRTPL